MKNIFKRFKLSEWLILSQIAISSLTLILTAVLGNEIIDLIGLWGNILNGVILIVVFVSENKKNIRSHELMGQFIFNQVGKNFSAFMDFLMSDQYEGASVEERNVLHHKLLETAHSDSYDLKRKLSRAIPYLFDIDRKMARDVVDILRKDICQDRTDIRRRTVEAAVSIIQRQPSLKKKRRAAREFFDLFSYHKYDDAYTVVACIEAYFFLHEFVFQKKNDRCLTAFAALKEDTARAFRHGVGYIEESLVPDLDHIWAVLEALAAMQDVGNARYDAAKLLLDETLTDGLKFSKLTLIKNLYYTCEGFPACLCGDNACDSVGSKYMMDKIHRFLTDAVDNNIFLVMPTVRYFDCVCSNVCKSEAKTVARAIIREYFSSEELLITQTAFDKFSKLLKEDRDFAREVLGELLKKETEHSAAESEAILSSLAALPEEERTYFAVEKSRIKLKNTPEYQRAEARLGEETKAVHDRIEHYNERIRFIGKIKKFKEDYRL